jgi:Zn-dependent protease with chaperone function
LLIAPWMIQAASAAPAAAQARPTASGVSQDSNGRITKYTLPPELHRKAHLFSRIRFGLRLFGVGYVLFLLWLVLKRRWSARFRDWAEALSHRGWVQALAYASLLGITIGVLHLPLDVLNEAVLKAYGVSIQPWDSWLGDWIKVLALLLALGALFAWILQAAIRRSPRRWWLAFWIVSAPIFVFLLFLQPLVIDPMFFDFEPLASKAPDLIPKLQSVTRKAGLEIPPERMFWMKASTKSIVANAYVTGLGASKRIVVWDTTLAQETTDGILTVFGHELGHYALGHVWKALAFFCLLTLALLYLANRTIGPLLAARGSAWGLRGLQDWACVPALLLLICAYGCMGGVLGGAFSRYEENQADIYSLEVTRGIVADPGQASAESFQRFGEKVFVDPDPNPLDVVLFFDHPTLSQRIRLFATYDPWSRGEEPRFVK